MTFWRYSTLLSSQDGKSEAIKIFVCPMGIIPINKAKRTIEKETKVSSEKFGAD